MSQGKEFTAEEKMEILVILKPYLQLGYTINKACQYANQPFESIYRWLRKDEILRREVESWQGMVNTQARQNIVKAITGDPKAGIKPDPEMSKWWAERMEKDSFSTRQENINTERTIKEVVDEFQDPYNLEYLPEDEEKTDTPVSDPNEGRGEEVLSA